MENIDFQYEYLQIATIYLQIYCKYRDIFVKQLELSIFISRIWSIYSILQYIDQYIGHYFRDIGKYWQYIDQYFPILLENIDSGYNRWL